VRARDVINLSIIYERSADGFRARDAKPFTTAVTVISVARERRPSSADESRGTVFRSDHGDPRTSPNGTKSKSRKPRPPRRAGRPTGVARTVVETFTPVLFAASYAVATISSESDTRGCAAQGTWSLSAVAENPDDPKP